MRNHCLCVVILIVFCGFWKSKAGIPEDTEEVTYCTPVIYGCSGEILNKLRENLKETQQRLKEQDKVIHEQAIQNVGNLKKIITEVIQTELKVFANDFGKSLTKSEENFNNRFNILEKKIEENFDESFEQLQSKFNSTEEVIMKNLQMQNQKFEENLKKDIETEFKKQNEDFLKLLLTKLEKFKPSEKENIENNSSIPSLPTTEISKQPSNCADALNDPKSSDGVYKINIAGLEPFDVFCMRDPSDKNSGAWTLIQRHVNGGELFDRNWHDYKNGFGNLKENFWLGLERLHVITSSQNYQLWIHIKDRNDTILDAKYNKFVIGSEQERYPLKELSEYSGNAGNGLRGSVGKKFSTNDVNNWGNGCENCAKRRGAGFWYYLNICWENDQKLFDSQYIHMAIRPRTL